MLGVLVLGLLGDGEVGARTDEVPDVLAGLLSTASTRPKVNRHE